MNSLNVYKWLAVILVIALVIPAVIGCGEKEAEEATSTPTPTVVPTATVPAEPTGETGTLSGLEGDVQVMRAGASAWEAATSGMKVGTGYGLKIGSDGYVLITFFDGSVMELEADTEISIEELSETSGGSTTVRINQVLGNTLNRVENLVDSSSTYEVETPAGSAVVRGTIYSVQVNQYGEITRTCCGTLDEGDSEEHSVAFSGGGSTVNVLEHQMSCGWEGGTPGAPFYPDSSDDPLDASTMGGGGVGSPCTWTGTWCLTDSNIELVQTGSEVTVSHSYGLVGTVSGNKLTFTIPQGECEGGTNSTVLEMTMSSDCNSFTARELQRCVSSEGEVLDEVIMYDNVVGTRGACPLPTCAGRQYSEAYTPTSEWQTISGSSDNWNEYFYYLFYLEAGHSYRFSTCVGGGSYGYGDPMLILANCAGSTVTYNYNYCNYGPQMDYTPTETGYYILEVGPYDGYAYNFTVAYRINEP